MQSSTHTRTIKTFIQEVGWGNVFLALLAVTLFTAYVWQVNISSTRSFAMHDLESTIEDLELQQEKYRIQIAKLQSIDSVSTRMKMLGMTEVQEIEYIDMNSFDNLALR